MDHVPAHVADRTARTVAETVSASGIPVHCAYDEIAEAEALVPNPRNPNRHSDEQIRLLAKIIKHQGWRAPITVSNRSGFIVRGHGRLAAAKLLGVDLVPVDRQAYTTEAEEWADLVADNRLSELSEMDGAALKDILQELDSGMLSVVGADMELTGYTDQALAELMSQFDPEEELQEVEAPEPPKTPVTQVGDLWLCEDHRLLCGDSTKVEDVARVMRGERAILFATDPPYLVNYTGLNHPSKWSERHTRRAKERQNKDSTGSHGITWDDAEANPDLYRDFVRVAQEIAIEPNAAWYCWHASRNYPMLEQVWRDAGAFVHQVLVWAKDRGVLTFSYYLWQHEVCAFGWVRPHQPPRIADDHPTTVWQIPTVPPGTKTEHPTSKPIQVFAIPMQQHVVVGGLCYEPFCGSGSQMIAGEQLGRRVYGLEISPQYVDVSVRRWQALTGKEAVLEATGQSLSEAAAARGVDIEC